MHSLRSLIPKSFNTFLKGFLYLKVEIELVCAGLKYSTLLDFTTVPLNQLVESIDLIEKTYNLEKSSLRIVRINQDAIHVTNIKTKRKRKQLFIDISKSLGEPKIIQYKPLIIPNTDSKVIEISTETPQDLVAWNGFLIGYPFVYCLPSNETENCLSDLILYKIYSNEFGLK